MKKENESKYHLGLCLLKIWMCYEVVLAHFGAHDASSLWTAPFYGNRTMAVPVFMLLSFTFARKTLMGIEPIQFISRLSRLYIPLIGWAVIYFVALGLMDLFLGHDHIDGIQDLIWQLLTGHAFNAPMWFQVNLIILSILFYLCCRKLPVKYYLPLAGGMVIAGLVMQYSGWNMSLFGELRYEMRYTLGRLCETLPYAAIGLALAGMVLHQGADIADNLQSKYARVALFALGVLFYGLGYLTWPPAPGFDNSGLSTLMFTLGIYCVFNSLSFTWLPQMLRKWVLLLAKYTMGIYCVHNLVGGIIVGTCELFGWEVPHNMLLTTAVFMVSYMACVVIACVPCKVCRQIVS